MEPEDIQRHRIWYRIYLIILLLLPIINIICDVLHQKYTDHPPTIALDMLVVIIEVLYLIMGLFNIVITIGLPHEVMYTDYYHEYINAELPDTEKLLHKTYSMSGPARFLRLFNCYRVTYTRAIPWCLYAYLLLLPWNMTSLIFVIIMNIWSSYISIVVLASFFVGVILSIFIFFIYNTYKNQTN